MMHVSKRVREMKLSIRKITELASAKSDCVRFDIGQPDFDVPQPIKEAAIEAVRNKPTGYTPVSGILPLREKIAEYESKKGIGFGAENVAVTSGGMNALENIFLAVLEPGDEVIIPSPCWPPYLLVVSTAHGKPVLARFFNEKGELDADAIESAVTRRTKAIVVNTPENPTGRVIGKRDLESIAGIAEKHGLVIVSDEVYDHILFDNEKHVSLASIAPERTVIVNSASKTFAMTGWRLGWLACADADFVEQVSKCNRATTACPNAVSQYAVLAALDLERSCIDEMVVEYAKRKEVMLSRVRSLGWGYVEPKGAFYVFPRVGFESWKFSADLIEKAGVSVVPGTPSGSGWEEYARFCFGSTCVEVIEEGFDRIEKFLNQ